MGAPTKPPTYINSAPPPTDPRERVAWEARQKVLNEFGLPGFLKQGAYGGFAKRLEYKTKQALDAFDLKQNARKADWEKERRYLANVFQQKKNLPFNKDKMLLNSSIWGEGTMLGKKMTLLG